FGGFLKRRARLPAPHGFRAGPPFAGFLVRGHGPASCRLAARGSSRLSSLGSRKGSTSTDEHHRPPFRAHLCMVVISASDGVMSERELKTIGQLVKTLPVFQD